MQSTIRISLLLALLSLSPTLAQPTFEEFPPDEPGLTVVDRAYKSIYSNDQESHFYAVLSNGKDQTYVDIYKGLPWKKIHRWAISFEGDPVKVNDRSVLQMEHQEEDKKIVFFYNDYAGYAEAAVHLALTYDQTTGTFSTSWSD